MNVPSVVCPDVNMSVIDRALFVEIKIKTAGKAAARKPSSG